MSNITAISYLISSVLFILALRGLSSPTTSRQGNTFGMIGMFGMDHGNPTLPGYKVFFCSDEHTTFLADEGGLLPPVGDKVQFVPAHVDPTVALHEWLHVVDGEQVIESWPVDLRNW